MNSQEYWRRRVLYAKQKELDSAADYEDAMRSRLKDLQNEINKEANVFVNRYAETNEISKEAATKILSSIDSTKWNMTLEEFKAKAKAGGYEKELDSEYFKSRIARLQSLHDQLADFASKYANSETGNMAVALAKRYNDTYLLENYNKYLVVGGLDIDLARFNEQQLKDIVYQPWRGSNFSKRIWENYTKVMPDVLTDVLLRSTLMGYNWQRTQRMLEDRFAGIEQKQLHRLVITEMGHAAEQATAKFYEDSKIDQYQYLATLETHTCDVCAHLDERIFNVKDEKEGINHPLMHPYCRCTTVPYMKGLPDIPTRWYRDPITGKGKWTRNMNYSEWAKVTGVKPFSKKKFIETRTRLGLAKLLHISGALNMSDPKDYGRALRHAERYYEELRNSDRAYIEQHIVQGSGLNRSIVNSALIHILDSEYDLIGNNGKHSYQKFSPDYDMAESLQRLILEEPEDHDIIMLQHEALEAHYMDDLGMNYIAAHLKANKSYNYQNALAKFLERRDKQ